MSAPVNAADALCECGHRAEDHADGCLFDEDTDSGFLPCRCTKTTAEVYRFACGGADRVVLDFTGEDEPTLAVAQALILGRDTNNRWVHYPVTEGDDR